MSTLIFFNNYNDIIFLICGIGFTFLFHSYYRWFDGFNWEGLRLRSLQPPITPKIQGHLDTSNFDDYPMDADGPPPGIYHLQNKFHSSSILIMNMCRFSQ